MIAGWIVCAALLLLGRALGATLLVGFLCSFAFGATAALPAGGSTMPASVVMTALVLVSILFGRRSWVGDLAAIFRQQPLAHLVLFLTLYAVASAYFMPRLFAGDISVFVPVKGLVTKVPVGPVSGNFNQSSYFIFDGLAFFAIAILLRRGQVAELRMAFLSWCSINAALGLIDFAGKCAGLGGVPGAAADGRICNAGRRRRSRRNSCASRGHLPRLPPSPLRLRSPASYFRSRTGC